MTASRPSIGASMKPAGTSDRRQSIASTQGTAHRIAPLYERLAPILMAFNMLHSREGVNGVITARASAPVQPHVDRPSSAAQFSSGRGCGGFPQSEAAKDPDPRCIDENFVKQRINQPRGAERAANNATCHGRATHERETVQRTRGSDFRYHTPV